MLEFGVPLGLTLGPLLITLYTSAIQDKISAQNLHCMFYSNDSQLYINIDHLDQRPAVTTPQKRISD